MRARTDHLTEAMRLALLLQIASTLAMFGLIWFVQVVHYPLFAGIGRGELREYAALHATRTTWVVAPLMLLELLSAALLVLPRFRPAAVGAAEAWTGAALLAAIWASTALVQVPLHNRLQASGESEVAQCLVTTNWVRTMGWSLRAALVLLWVWRGLAL